MGFYIQSEDEHKARGIMAQFPATKQIAQPRRLTDFPPDTAIVCVVDNVNFMAAGIAIDQNELGRFRRDDGRDKIWLLMRKADILASRVDMVERLRKLWSM